jgi:hypothetical protein|tara:strand:- start:8168 stop:8350 length:183 start_codon:yes stop_codon:yes gene_type:complete
MFISIFPGVCPYKKIKNVKKENIKKKLTKDQVFIIITDEVVANMTIEMARIGVNIRKSIR